MYGHDFYFEYIYARVLPALWDALRFTVRCHALSSVRSEDGPGSGRGRHLSAPCFFP